VHPIHSARTVNSGARFCRTPLALIWIVSSQQHSAHAHSSPRYRGSMVDRRRCSTARTTRLLPPAAAAHAIHEVWMSYLFLIGMMLLPRLPATRASSTGSQRRCRHARWLGCALFLLIYLAGTVVTIFLSNDCDGRRPYPCRTRGGPPCQGAAASLSAHLRAYRQCRPASSCPISNPANLVIFDAQMPTLAN